LFPLILRTAFEERRFAMRETQFLVNNKIEIHQSHFDTVHSLSEYKLTSPQIKITINFADYAMLSFRNHLALQK